ncbi:Beta-barrel assembly-enhancing protease [bacterium HR21]|nr:Beta-barrel assembly-enhancing protease [bacterium HR21]
MRQGVLWVVVLCGAGLGFHCASPEFTTAKIALGQRDYPKALRSLELETQKNPGNVEAWILLAQLRREHFRDYTGAAQALQNARANDKAGRWTQQIAAEELALWVAVYNEAISLYNALAVAAQPDPERLAVAQRLIELAVRLKPDVPDAYGILGTLQELSGDTTAALQTFARYRELLQPLLEAHRRVGLVLGMTRGELFQKLGQPAASRAFPTETDTLFVDQWQLEGEPLYVFSAGAGAQARVEGWRYRAPQHWTQTERERYSRLALQPLVSAAIALLDRGQLEEALGITREILEFKPDNEQGLALLLEIYERQGRTEELVQLLQQLRERFPEKTTYTLQYAILLTKLERYSDAVSLYEEVLRREPTNELALYNAAVAYKNWAGKLQQEELEKRRQNPRYQEQRERYAPLLRRSAELFEQYRSLPGKREELSVLDQLVNIYEVLPDPGKLNRLVAELEGLEPLFRTQARYYEILGGIYARRGQKEKAQQYYDRADQLRKQQ